ncbi:MAG: alpha/beta fold hydrolase [Limisphaerales bacterium]
MKRILITFATVISVAAVLLGMDLGRFAFKSIDAGGHKVRMLICGHGTPTVVFETGGSGASGGPLEYWDRVQPEVSKLTRTVSYDRAGIGWSAPGPQPRDARQIAKELHIALGNAGLPPPFILVGHSFGGPFIRVFADMYPREVSGMVLVDPTQEEFIAWNQSRNTNQDERMDREWKDIRASLAEAHESTVPKGVPVVLITGMGRPVFADSMTEKQRQEYIAVHQMWLRFHAEWIKNVPKGQHILTQKSEHDVPVTEPDLIVGVIRQMVKETRNRDFTNAIHAYLQQCIEGEKISAGIVVGIVDEQRSGIVSYGKLDNGTDKDVNGDTVFEIGSVTKTFTGLLLQDMIQRGEMKLDDPVAKYLPASVKMPARNGKEITLRQLATHTSGLPGIPDNLDPKRADNPYADYTVGKLYAFLSGHNLTRDPGAASEYSNLGMGLLGHAIALKAGTNFEPLVVGRICRPLKMESTGITLTPELKNRLAIGHDLFGEIAAGWDVPVLSGAGALRSTANDLLKYVSANLGLTRSSLTPLMKKTYEKGLAWGVNSELPGTEIISHGGSTGGYQSFVGFDKVRRHGVVVLFNGRRVIDVSDLGKFLLRSEWGSDRRPIEIKLSSQVPKLLKPHVAIKLDTRLLDAVVGQYEFAPSAATRPFTGMNLKIWREGGRLSGQTRGENTIQGAFDIYPESETNFFIKLNGARLTFIMDDKGEVTALIHHEEGLPVLKGKKLKN